MMCAAEYRARKTAMLSTCCRVPLTEILYMHSMHAVYCPKCHTMIRGWTGRAWQEYKLHGTGPWRPFMPAWLIQCPRRTP